MVYLPVIGVCLAYLVHSQHTVFYLTKCFSRDQLQSLQRILYDAVENTKNSSPCTIGICLPAENDVVLCLVQYLSASPINCVIFQYENSLR
jgi:hypothetical protein